MADIYLSYARSDALRIAPLATELRKLGLSVWLDQEIQAGSFWMEEIEKALHESPLLVLCLSPSYLASAWANVEIGVAVSRARTDAARVVAVLLSDADVPFVLRERTYIDGRNMPPEEVANAINTIARRSEAS